MKDAITPAEEAQPVVIKCSTRRRDGKSKWWFTIIAPTEVLSHTESIWPTLQASTSWSLENSLQKRSRAAPVNTAVDRSRPDSPQHTLLPSIPPPFRQLPSAGSEDDPLITVQVTPPSPPTTSSVADYTAPHDHHPGNSVPF